MQANELTDMENRDPTNVNEHLKVHRTFLFCFACLFLFICSFVRGRGGGWIADLLPLLPVLSDHCTQMKRWGWRVYVRRHSFVRQLKRMQRPYSGEESELDGNLLAKSATDWLHSALLKWCWITPFNMDVRFSTVHFRYSAVTTGITLYSHKRSWAFSFLFCLWCIFTHFVQHFCMFYFTGVLWGRAGRTRWRP